MSLCVAASLKPEGRLIDFITLDLRRLAERAKVIAEWRDEQGEGHVAQHARLDSGRRMPPLLTVSSPFV
jgi:hypothetical protein